jgi:hypothetical protein
MFNINNCFCKDNVNYPKKVGRQANMQVGRSEKGK